jgi:hypothetical protein
MSVTALTRRQQAMQYVANAVNFVKLNQALAYREMGVRITGQLTLSAANNTQANTKKGDEWALVKNIRILGNSSEVLFNMSGDDLFWHNVMFYGAAPKISVQLGNGAANPSFDSYLILPFWTPRTAKPMDTLFEAPVGLSDFRVEITFGDHTSINGSATGFTSGPSVEISSHEQELSPYFSPAFIKRTNLQTLQVLGASPALRFNLDIGTPRYLGFLINCTDNATGADVPAAFSNVKLISGSTIFFDLAEPTLLQWQRDRLGLPWFIDKTPNVAAAPLADAFGVTSGAIADVGGAFAQATLNNNFRAVSDRLDAVTNLCNGQAYQMQPRVSSASDYRAWYPVFLPTDGFLSEAPDSRGLNELYLEFATSQACTIRVVNLQLIPNPRRRAVAKYPTGAQS